MEGSLSFWGLVANADPVVKFIMFVLLVCSVWSWAIMVQKALVLKNARVELRQFLNEFWHGQEMSSIYSRLNRSSEPLFGLSRLFFNGFKSFVRLHRQSGLQGEALMDGVERVMRVHLARESDNLEHHLALLATIGSVAPYIGLLGTVWGIMASFSALGGVEQATLAIVAPHIAEALIATALGLFVAIPAVVAYNRFSRAVESVVLEYENFQDDFCSVLHKQAYGL